MLTSYKRYIFIKLHNTNFISLTCMSRTHSSM